MNKEKNEYILIIKEKDSIIENKELEFKEYQKEYLKLKNDFEIMNSENDKLKQKIYLLEQDTIKMKEDNNKLNEEYTKLNEEYIKMKEDNNKLNQEYIKLNEEYIKINKEYTKLNEEYTKYKNTNEIKRDNEIKDLEGKIKKFKEELKRNNNNISNNINLGGVKAKSKRMSLKYNFKFDQMLNNLEKKKIIQNKKNSLKLNKLVIPEEKKINEDENKEEKGIERDYEKTQTEENKITEGNVRILENYEKDTLNKNSIIKDENKIEQPIIDKNENVKNNNEEINDNNNNKSNDIEITKNQNNFINKNSIMLPIPENSDNYMRSKSNDNAINRKEEKSNRMSKALNRFKKNRTNQNQDVRSNSGIKESKKINEIAKMLEQKISGRSEDKKEVSYDNKALTDDETDRELNMVELLKSKPISKKKAKPSIKNKF